MLKTKTQFEEEALFKGEGGYVQNGSVMEMTGSVVDRDHGTTLVSLLRG